MYFLHEIKTPRKNPSVVRRLQSAYIYIRGHLSTQISPRRLTLYWCRFYSFLKSTCLKKIAFTKRIKKNVYTNLDMPALISLFNLFKNILRSWLNEFLSIWLVLRQEIVFAIETDTSQKYKPNVDVTIDIYWYFRFDLQYIYNLHFGLLFELCAQTNILCKLKKILNAKFYGNSNRLTYIIQRKPALKLTIMPYKYRN